MQAPTERRGGTKGLGLNSMVYSEDSIVQSQLAKMPGAMIDTIRHIEGDICARNTSSHICAVSSVICFCDLLRTELVSINSIRRSLCA
eukprot:529524-Pleurochrysis_carterae.AAC.1